MGSSQRRRGRAALISILDHHDELVESTEHDDPRRTPAPKKDRIKGSRTNPKGSASSAKSGKSIKFSAAVEKGLQNKLRNYRKEMSSRVASGKASKAHNVTMGMLRSVFRRGLGAFSSSHLPGMSRNGWAYARVNAFLHLVKTGRPKKAAYVQDNDLLPSTHKRKTQSESVAQPVDLDYYRMLQEHAEPEDFMEDIGSMSECVLVVELFIEEVAS